MKLILLAAGLAIGAVHAQDHRVPVVVELFTSEGCSSCPPAEQMLLRLADRQPVAGARIIPLEEHVDYWNQLGWTDPFSSAIYRARQNDYATRLFFTDNIYTPQIVVGGQVGFSGGNGKRAQEEIVHAIQAQSVAVDLKAAADRTDADLVDLTVQVTNLKNTKLHNSNVFLAVTESGLSTNVGSGENAGRMLWHAPVVRSFGVIGKLDSKGANGGQIVNTMRLPQQWQRQNLRVVVFVQERDSYKITGAGTTDLQ